jgi:spermidine synthase
MESNSSTEQANLSSRQTAWLLISVLVVALCGIAYELIIAAVSSYLLGNSVAQFSITIGLFMFAMGIGSYLTKFIEHDLVVRFVEIEIAIAAIGGFCAALLFVVFPYYALYQPVMYSLILIIGTLVGLEIPILTRILTENASVSESIAHVLSLDYVGALIGSVSFPLLLLPSLGLFRSSFAIGLLNIAIAVLSIAILSKRYPRLRWYWIPTTIILVALIIGMLYSTVVAKFAEGQLFADEMIFTQQTPYQRIVMTKHPRNGEVRLYLDGHLQFAGSDEHRYHEALVHPVMSVGRSPAKILVLGGGDGLAVREILKFPEVQSVDVVDIDPAMTSLALEFGPIRAMNRDSFLDKRVTVHHQDAFNFVQQAYATLEKDRTWYDRIIIDLPDPHSEVLNKLYSTEFYKLVNRILASDGCIVTQSASPIITREAFWCIHETIDQSGFQVLPYRIFLNSFGEWGFNLAVKDGERELLERVTLRPVERRFLDDATLGAAQVFSLDDGKMDMPVNSLFEPKLYMLYEMGLKR